MQCIGVIQSNDANKFLCPVAGHPGFFKLKKDNIKRRKYVNHYTYKFYKYPERYHHEELMQRNSEVCNGAFFNNTNSTGKETRYNHQNAEFVNTDLMIHDPEHTRNGPSSMDEAPYMWHFLLLERNKMLTLVAKSIFGACGKDCVPSIMLNFFPGIKNA